MNSLVDSGAECIISLKMVIPPTPSDHIVTNICTRVISRISSHLQYNKEPLPSRTYSLDLSPETPFVPSFQPRRARGGEDESEIESAPFARACASSYPPI